MFYVTTRRLKEEILSHKSVISRCEDDKRELSNLVETLRDTNEKGGKLNLKLEEELLDKVSEYQGGGSPAHCSKSVSAAAAKCGMCNYS